jgi:membrane protein YqaA with SNARE-associated domain
VLTAFGLFVSAFLSATILPGSSEAALLLTLTTASNPIWLITIATIGNTLGASTSWGMARYLPHYLTKKSSPKYFQNWADLFQRYGKWSLLFTWVPVVGDAIPVAAGLSGMSFWRFAPLVLIGKALRYLVVAGLFQQFWQV